MGEWETIFNHNVTFSLLLDITKQVSVPVP